ncbi:histidine kinase [Epilithonimonas tenax]|uniref:histidine kinase n=1 Tax=Epilithonimonas tenax TaxID=191577 RepID=UPI001E28E68F|nr:histidine kinase [Epilithonimonas tenax]
MCAVFKVQLTTKSLSKDVDHRCVDLYEANIQALKTQINPHFMFNTLNDIYSLVCQKSEKALPAIEGRSQLLRYNTKDLERDFIPLEKENG